MQDNFLSQCLPSEPCHNENIGSLSHMYVLTNLIMYYAACEKYMYIYIYICIYIYVYIYMYIYIDIYVYIYIDIYVSYIHTYIQTYVHTPPGLKPRSTQGGLVRGGGDANGWPDAIRDPA